MYCHSFPSTTYTTNIFKTGLLSKQAPLIFTHKAKIIFAINSTERAEKRIGNTLLPITLFVTKNCQPVHTHCEYRLRM